MRILYDSKKAAYKTPFGCLEQEETCTMHISIPCSCKTTAVEIVFEHEDGTPYLEFGMTLLQLDALYETYERSFSLPDCGLYYYYFRIHTDNSTFSLYKEGSHNTSMNYGGKWQLTCYPKGYDTPNAFKGKVMYQIFPDRFYQEGTCDLTEKITPYTLHENKSDIPVYYPDEHGIVQNNDFFGGNLKGIQKKLPYLQELGVSILYLNPIFKAYSNHRYDTADYRKIDPLLGTEEDFKNLCDAAHACGMKVILDGVFSHTGCDSVYFDKYERFGHEGAYHHPDSPYRSWYQFHGDSNNYTSWWGIDTLPCTEELNPDYMNFIIRDDDSVVAHWLRAGADGFRLDVVDEIPDGFVKVLHDRVHEIKKDALIIGEVWEDASNKIAYSVRRTYFTNSELDSVMNYPYKDAIISFLMGSIPAETLANKVMTIAENYPKPVLDCVMNSLSTHDTMRILTVFGCNNLSMTRDEKAYFSLKAHQLDLATYRLCAAAFLQFTLPGTACIYYGDEAGLQGFEDPFNRRFFPWDRINPTIHNFYKKLAKVKNTERALQVGTIQILNESDGIFAFSREANGEKVIAIVSTRDYFPCFTSYQPLISYNASIEESQIVLHKYGCVLLKTNG